MALSFNISVDSASPLLNYAAGSWNPIPSTDAFFPLYANGSTGMVNSFDTAQNTGGTVSLNFVGSRVWAFGAKRTNHGFYTASVDSNDTRTLDGFAASNAQAFQAVLYDSGELPNGNHTMEIVNIGPSGGPGERTAFDIDWVTYETSFGAPGANATSQAVIPTLVNASTSNLLLSPSTAWTQSSNPSSFSSSSSSSSSPVDVSSGSSNASGIVQSTSQSGASVSYAFQIPTSSGSGAVAMYGAVGQNQAAYKTLLTQDGQVLPQFSASVPASGGAGGGRPLSNKMLFFAGDLPAGHVYNLTLTNDGSGSGSRNARRQNQNGGGGGAALQVDMVQTFASGTAASTVPPDTNVNRPRPPPTTTTTATSASATSTSTSTSQTSTSSSTSASSTTTSSATASATTTAASGSGQNTDGIIIGSVFGGVIGLVVIGTLVYFYLMRRNRRLAAARASETRAIQAANMVIGRPNLFAPDQPPSRVPFAAAPYPMGTGGRAMLGDEFDDRSSDTHGDGGGGGGYDGDGFGGVGEESHRRSFSNGSMAVPPLALAPPVHSYGADEYRTAPPLLPMEAPHRPFRVYTADGIREISTELPRSNRYPRTMPLPFLANADRNV